MAHNSSKTPPSLCEKKTSSNSISKKKQCAKLSPSRNVENQPRANLQRGKIPLNWNLYLEQNTNERSNKKTKTKLLLPKTITSQAVSSQQVCSAGRLSYASSVQAMHPLPAPSCNQYGCLAVGPLPPNLVSLPSTGRCVAIDCEMVGVGDGRDNMLARVSLVDEHGTCIYDTFVKPMQEVIDYRTAVSGVRPVDLEHGKEFVKVQEDVYEIIKGKLLVGHALRNDLKVLLLSHPRKLIRDTSKFKKFREEVSGRTPSLRFLAAQLLGIEIQSGEHSSVEDARAAMKLYMKHRHSWEKELRTKYFH